MACKGKGGKKGKGGFTFDENSQNLLRNAKESLADDATRNWTTNDGVVVTMSK